MEVAMAAQRPDFHRWVGLQLVLQPDNTRLSGLVRGWRRTAPLTARHRTGGWPSPKSSGTGRSSTASTTAGAWARGLTLLPN